jgi:hypothetical protein
MREQRVRAGLLQVHPLQGCLCILGRHHAKAAFAFDQAE